MPRVAVITNDPVGAQMAGPGIRAVEVSRILAEAHDVRLCSSATKSDDHVRGVPVHVITGDSQMQAMNDWADILIFQGGFISRFPWMASTAKVLVVDLYDPRHLEALSTGRSDAVQPSVALFAVLAELKAANFIICASEKQRDLWLGHLAAIGRLSSESYAHDPSFRGLIDVVPFGVGSEPATKKRSGLRGVVSGIGPEDKVVLWGGGLYEWFDPRTLIDAVSEVRKVVPTVRLVFPGAAHPNSTVMNRTAIETRMYATEQGLLGSHVFFLKEWIPYKDRADVLLDADVGVSTHFDTVETRFAYRTRTLDYIWAALPIVATKGDVLAELSELNGWGRTVDPEDSADLAQALIDLLDNDVARDGCRQKLMQAQPHYSWQSAVRPLLAFCSDYSDSSSTSTRQRREQERNQLFHGVFRHKRAALTFKLLLAAAAMRSVGFTRTATHIFGMLRRKLGR